MVTSFQQNGEELDCEVEWARDSDGDHIDFVSNKNGKLQVVNLKDLYKECGEDDKKFEAKKLTLISQILKAETSSEAQKI